MDIAKTLRSLSKRDREFDPMAGCFDFENPDSLFWKKVFDSSCLQGILYGFGERNAYFFTLWDKCPGDIKAKEEKHSLLASQSARPFSPDDPDKKTIRDLKIPNFRSFTVPLEKDPAIVNFEKERELIIQELRGKNFAQEVLKKITGNSASQKAVIGL